MFVSRKLLMTPRLIYEVSEHLKYSVQWINVTKSEWIYCGIKDELNLDLIKIQIYNHLIDSKVYLSIS